MKNWWEDDVSELTSEKVAEFDYVLAAFAGITKEGWHRTQCPRCLELDGKKDSKQSLGYNTRTGGYNCFKCGMHGSLPVSYQERLRDEDPAELRAIKPVTAPTASAPVELAEGYMPLFEEPCASASIFQFARDYLTMEPGAFKHAYGYKGGRRLPEKTCAEMKIGAALRGHLFGRVIVPIFDYEDLTKPWRGWVARDATGKSTLSYLYSKNMIRIGLLYNEPALYVETDRPCYVVEGTLDVAALWPDAVGVLGSPLDSHIEKFVHAKRPIVMVLDGDAWEKGQSVAWTLQHAGVKAGNIRLPPSTDPDEVSRKWLDEMARRSIL